MVEGDGDWSVELHRHAMNSRNLHVEYLSLNRFYKIVDEDNNLHAWAHSVNFSNNGSNLDIGDFYADLTVDGDLPGLRNVTRGASRLWSKFYNAGINPLRAHVIKITFPNLSGNHCKTQDSNGNDIPWSCSYSGQIGHIEIATAHTADQDVVSHELAHTVNKGYWVFPQNSGGPHDLTNCFTDGLALTEGFANFVAYWIEHNANSTNPIMPFTGMNLDTLPASITCTNETNEMRVAATFWDLFDIGFESGANDDSNDSMHFNNRGTVLSKYLGTRKVRMSDFLPVYQNGLSNSIKSRVEKIFRHNLIIQ